MATIEKFEDIDAWKKARKLTQSIYRISGSGRFAKDFGLRDQMRRASVSIMSNIAEGFGRGGNKELIQFLSIAKGSALEIQSQLYVALDVGYLSKEQFRELYVKTDETVRLIAGFLKYLKQSTIKGQKYKRLQTRNPKPQT